MCEHKRNHQTKPSIRFTANYHVYTCRKNCSRKYISSYTSILKEREIYMLYYTITVKIIFCKGFI